MLSLILLAILQGIPVPASQAGSITGVLTLSTGKPAAGVRVSALARPESASDALLMSAMAGIAETDANGAYKLENIPPGRYYIVAGRLDQPTYYPGALEMSAGKDVLITPGAALTGLNFSLKDNSVGRAGGIGGALILATSWNIPTRVIVEGGKIPISDTALFPVLRLTRVSDNQTLDVPLTATSMVVPLNPSPEYRVTVENLSRRYRVKAIISDKADLLANTLKLPAPSGPIALPPTASTAFQQVAVWTFSVNGNVVSIFSPSSLTGTTVAFSMGLPQTVVPPLPPVPTIEVTLVEVADTSQRTGVTIFGTLADPVMRSIEAAGIAGSVYEDGTFEVRNVPPGRHTLLTRNNPPGTRPVGASLIVGNEDIRNPALQPILETPRSPDAGVVLPTRENLTPGSVVPLATVRGQVVDEGTGARFNVDRSIGRITVNGNTISYTINNTGDFEIQSLLPGRYDLEAWISGGKPFTRTIDVGDSDVTIQWPLSIPD
ncbi:MAG TPA: carboxypeptidase regulatory-like domain-containing protein [Terriglobia bacterium]|nr:carboxypeptidase regulatory-like domain-containing protein [Terriglobia bacterium]